MNQKIEMKQTFLVALFSLLYCLALQKAIAFIVTCSYSSCVKNKFYCFSLQIHCFSIAKVIANLCLRWKAFFKEKRVLYYFNITELCNNLIFKLLQKLKTSGLYLIHIISILNSIFIHIYFANRFPQVRHVFLSES